MRVVALLSGGLDSIVMMAILKEASHDVVAAVGFNYGQRHDVELKAARDAAKFYGVQYFEVRAPLQNICFSPLLSEAAPKKAVGGISPNVVPNRNMIFLSYAAALATFVEADGVAIGATKEDYNGFPDCRPEFFSAFSVAASLSLGRKIDVLTPLSDMTKSDVINSGFRLFVPFENTMSCYAPRVENRIVACGECDSCRIRLAGFSKANKKDPMLYASCT